MLHHHRILLVLCIALSVLSVGFAADTTVSNQTKGCTAKCSVPGGYDKSVCDWYSGSYASSWLPTGYAVSAKCVCLGNESSVWDSATANCVRKQIRVGTGLIDPTVQGTLYALKITDCGLTQCSQRYYDYVNATFIPAIYQIHVNAYKSCCCPGTPPAAANFLSLITSYAGFYPCDFLVDAVSATAPCGCQGW